MLVLQNEKPEEANDENEISRIAYSNKTLKDVESATKRNQGTN
jgi:hypothetical protein